MEPIGFIGTGVMGTPMIQALLGEGYHVHFYSRQQEKIQELEMRGASSVKNLIELTNKTKIIISMLPDDNASREVWLGELGTLHATTKERLVIECSTLSVEWVREISNRFNEKGICFLDAPVSGSKPQAEKALLQFFVSGKEAIYLKAMPLFKAMGAHSYYFGESPSATIMKLINNFLNAVQMASLGEALQIAKDCNLDFQKVSRVLTQGAPGSPLVRTKLKFLEEEPDTIQSRLELMCKDLDYASKLSKSSNQKFSILKFIKNVYLKAARMGLSEKDVMMVKDVFR